MKKALVLTLAFALGLGIAAFGAAPLSGEWSSDITIAPQQTNSFTGFDSTITVDYTVGSWTFESVTGFALTGWTKQAFSADGVLGAFTIGSDLVFAPATAAFTSWDSTGSVSIAGVSFTGEFLLADGSGWTFGASGDAGDLSLGAKVYFNMDSAGNLVQTGPDAYCFCFSSVDFTASFPFACIDLVNVTLGFSAENGFDGVTFAVKGIDLPGISWITFDASLTFDTGVTGKSLTLTPNFVLGDSSCFTLYVAFVDHNGVSCQSPSQPLEITGIEVYGIGLSQDLGGVTFSSQSSFVPAKNKAITGNADYWEVFTISSSADSCCGGGFSFALDTYFSCDSAALFDWGETDASISYGLGSNFTISTGLNVTSAGFTKWTLGFDVTW